MIYDRPYMRAQPVYNEFNVLKWLLIANFAVFIIQVIVEVGFGSRWTVNNFGLSLSNLQQFKFWTLLSHGFLHSTNTPFHILFNMLGLFLFGRELKDRLGSHRFLQLYLVCLMAGGIAWLALKFTQYLFNSHLYFPPLIGASGAVAGLLTVWCIKRWQDHIQFSLFFVMMPFYITGRTLFLGILIYESVCFLVFEFFTGRGIWNVAHSAHLGGIAAGWLFNKFVLNDEPIFNRSPRRERATVTASTTARPSWMPTQEAAKVQPLRYKVNVTNRDALRAEVDRILDKITEKGFGALTADEKETLNKARDILNG